MRRMKAKQVHPTIASALLVDARRRAGLTQEEVARRAASHVHLFHSMRTGKRILRDELEPIDSGVRNGAAPARGSLERGRSSSGVSRCRGGNRRGSTNAQRARAGLVQMRRLTPAEKAGSNA